MRKVGKPANLESLKRDDPRLVKARKCTCEGCTNMTISRTTTGLCYACWQPKAATPRKAKPLKDEVLILSGIPANGLAGRGRTWLMPAPKVAKVKAYLDSVSVPAERVTIQVANTEPSEDPVVERPSMGSMSCWQASDIHRLLRYLLLFHPHPKMWPK